MNNMKEHVPYCTVLIPLNLGTFLVVQDLVCFTDGFSR